MTPVRGYTMLNFLHWLTRHHPEIRRLREQPEDVLLDLVNEFEEGKLTGNKKLRYKWSEGFRSLFEGHSNSQGYDKARHELTKLEYGGNELG